MTFTFRDIYDPYIDPYIVTVYLFQSHHLSPKVNWYTNKSEVKYPSINTCQVQLSQVGINLEHRRSQVQSPLEVTFFARSMKNLCL